MLIDTHAHLSDPRYGEELGQVVERAKSEGVEIIIVPTVGWKDVEKVIEISSRYSGIYGLVGLYPGEATKNHKWREDLVKMEAILVSNPKFVGVGEIGLDVYWNERNFELESMVFMEQMAMACRVDKPVAIHNRASHEAIKKLIESMSDIPRGVFHCFSGDLAFLQWVIERGFYIGFDGNITYKSNRELRELMKMVPEDRLLLETDSPYLPPEGKRGTRNEPANVKIAAEMVARERGVPLVELARQTSQNARQLFRI